MNGKCRESCIDEFGRPLVQGHYGVTPKHTEEECAEAQEMGADDVALIVVYLVYVFVMMIPVLGIPLACCLFICAVRDSDKAKKKNAEAKQKEAEERAKNH